MPALNPSPKDLFAKVKNTDDVKARLAQENVQAVILTPLSDDTPDTVLSHMVAGYFDGFYSNTPHKEFTTAALDAIEKAEPDAAARAALLTAAGPLGKTVFHLALRYGGNLPLFETLTDRLYKWAGEEKADAFMKNLLTEPLGKIDRDVSYTLQSVREVRPWGSPEAQKVDALTTDSYHPATLEALEKAVDEIRPLVLEWLDKNPADPKDSYKAGKNAQLKSLAESPDAVQGNGTLLTQSFPGETFEKFLNLQQKFDPLSPQGQADRIFAMLSAQDAEGKTAMHRGWQGSLLMGPAAGPGTVRDMLGGLIATFDRMLGTDIAVALTSKLLLQENKKGELPLDRFEYNELPTRDYYIEGFLYNLRKELGSKEKFTTYMKEVVAAVLPADFTISMAQYEPEEINTETGKPKPKRGARLDF